MLQKALTVQVPVREKHEIAPVGVFRALALLAVFIFFVTDLFVNRRYLRYESGVATRDVRTATSRLPPWNLTEAITQPYCNNQSYDFVINELNTQYTVGRWCATNFGCNAWINSDDLIKVSKESLTLITAMSGIADPSEPPQFESIEKFYAPQLEYYLANYENKSAPEAGKGFAWYQLMAQRDLAYTCSPSFFPSYAEKASVFMYHGVDAESTSLVLNPKTNVYDGNGKLLRQYKAGEVLILNVIELLGLSLDGPHTPTSFASLNGVYLGDAPTSKLRTLGTQATLTLSYHNRDGEVVCDIRVKRFPNVLGFLGKETMTGRILDRPTIEALQVNHTWGSRALGFFPKAESQFRTFGITLHISTEVSMGVTDPYSILQHITSGIVLAGVALTMTQVFARAWLIAAERRKREQQADSSTAKGNHSDSSVEGEQTTKKCDLAVEDDPRVFSPRKGSPESQWTNAAAGDGSSDVGGE